MPDKGSPLGGATTGTAAGGPTEERIHRIRRRLERLIGVAATEGNAVRPLRNGDEITNFNRRSLDHDEEVMLAVMDTELTAFLDAHYDEDLKVSELIRPDRWKRRSLLQRVRETAVLPIRRYL